MRHKLTILKSVLLLVLAASTLISGCGVKTADNSALDANAEQELKTEQKLSDYDAEVKSLKIARFDYIFTFKRKDGSVMNGEDKRFVKDNSHFSTNRFTLSNDDKVIFAGSNYRFPEKGLEALNERFDVEDHSTPEEILEERRKLFREKAKKAKAKQAEKEKKKTQNPKR